MVVRSHKIYEYVFEDENEHEVRCIRSFHKYSDKQLEQEQKIWGCLIEQSEYVEEIDIE